MAFNDITAKGAEFDKFQLLEDREFFEIHFQPRLDMDGTPFVINKIPCGWDRWNRCFRSLKDVSDNASDFSVMDNNKVSWDYDDGFINHIRKHPMKRHSIEQIITEHHRLRAVFKEMVDAEESPDEIDTSHATAGIIDLMRWLNFGKQTISTMRLFLTKHNGEIVKIYEEKNGRNSFDEAFPFERLNSKELEKKGLTRPDDYEYRLLKGLKLHPWYRKPRKQPAIKTEANEDDKNFVLELFK